MTALAPQLGTICYSVVITPGIPRTLNTHPIPKLILCLVAPPAPVPPRDAFSIAARCLARYGVSAAEVKTAFGAERLKWIEGDVEGWLSENGFYPEAVAAVQKLVARVGDRLAVGMPINLPHQARALVHGITCIVPYSRYSHADWPTTGLYYHHQESGFDDSTAGEMRCIHS